MSNSLDKRAAGGAGGTAALTRAAPSAVDAIVTNIRKLISEEGLRVGDSLPTERELCERFQASRNTVREAMRILKAYGMVTVRPKVGATIIDDRMERVFDLFSFNTMEVSRNTFTEIQGFRSLLEVASVDHIFDNITDEDIVDLRRINDSMRYIHSIPEASNIDFQFHLRLVSILDNTAVRDVYRIMKPVIIRIMELGKSREDFAEGTYSQHLAIIEALEARSRISYQYALQSHLHLGFKTFIDEGVPAS
jgi:GntR family transcriptional repressor for pyruvate dehydrogenase complex